MLHDRQQIEELSSSLEIRHNATFLGFRNRQELLKLYNIADIFALNYSEGLPRAMLEAMACGSIPIVTNAEDTSSVVVDGFNGFMVPAGFELHRMLRLFQVEGWSLKSNGANDNHLAKSLT